MDWYQIINFVVGVLGTVVGIVGGSFGIIYWKENKALKAAEAKDKQTDVEMKQAEEWNKLYKEQKQKSDEKSTRLKALYAERDRLKEGLRRSEFAEERLCWFYCNVNNCPKRQPPHRFDEKGREIQADIFDKKSE